MHFAYDQSFSSSQENRKTKDEETEVVGDCTLSSPFFFISNTGSTLSKHGPKPSVLILSSAFLPGKQGGTAELSISVKSDTRYLHDKLHV